VLGLRYCEPGEA
jgi:hypothetical protein